eukprot:448714-Rhodomonas_salina.2
MGVCRRRGRRWSWPCAACSVARRYLPPTTLLCPVQYLPTRSFRCPVQYLTTASFLCTAPCLPPTSSLALSGTLLYSAPYFPTAHCPVPPYQLPVRCP